MRHEQLVRARRCEHLGGVDVDECAGIAQIDHGDGISRAGKHTGQRGGCLGSQVAFELGRSRHGRLNMLRDADWERTLPDPDLSEKLSSEEPSSAALPSVGSTVAPDRAAPADETLPDEPSPSFEHPRTDNSTTIVTTENIAISTVRRRRTYVSSRVGYYSAARRVRPPTRADTTAGMRHDAAQDTSRPAPRRAHMLCHRVPPRPFTSTPPIVTPRTQLVRGEHPHLGHPSWHG